MFPGGLCRFPHLRCYVSCLTSFVIIIVIGMIIAYPSPAFPAILNDQKLQAANGSKITIDALSWFASFAGLFAVPGSIILVPFMDRFGRKFSLMMCLIPLTVGWLLNVSTYNIITLGVSRAILGLAIGMVYSTIPIYLSEISPKEIRGKVGAFLAVAAYIGGLFTNILGAFLTWRWVALVCLALTTLASFACGLMYETPRWLVSKGYKEAAAEVISSTRSLKDSNKISAEVDEIAASLQNVKRLSFCQGLKALLTPPLWKPFLITQLLMVFQQFTGAAYIHNYTVKIFKEATVSLQIDNVIFKNSNYAASLVIFVFVLGSILSAFIVDHLGRRVLLLASGIGLTIALTAIGAYYYVLSVDPDFANHFLFWLPLASLALYDFGYGVAFGGLPFLLISEIFPIQVRAVANGMGSFNHNICFFIVVKVFASLKSVPSYGMFWIYASVGLISVVFIYFFIPETKGRSLEEIQKQWYPESKPTVDNNNSEMSSRL